MQTAVITQTLIVVVGLIIMFMLGRRSRDNDFLRTINNGLDMSYNNAKKRGSEDATSDYAAGACEIATFLLKNLFKSHFRDE